MIIELKKQCTVFICYDKGRETVCFECKMGQINYLREFLGVIFVLKSKCNVLVVGVNKVITDSEI